uniref:Chromo domain-containing protein n=1 Tax=Davidia involucrata TaxID=16924 RepID=A0A5B6Z003_DAVIN
MYLRCLTGDQSKEWVKWIPWIKYSYNTSYQSSIKTTPFNVVYGQSPPNLLSYVLHTTAVDAVDKALVERDALLQTVKQRLVEAQHRMKRVYDLRHRYEEFELGDWVYLRLQPYRQLSIKIRKNQKLSPKCYGPYKVIQKINTVAYKLELPSDSRVHPVFHISLLKKRVGSDVVVQSSPPCYAVGDPSIAPQAILERKTHKDQCEVLVHWKGFSVADATWENLQELKVRYPHFTLEDKDILGGEELSRS